jgi:predicted DNA-binding ribbon-helix-helix protein
VRWSSVSGNPNGGTRASLLPASEVQWLQEQSPAFLREVAVERRMTVMELIEAIDTVKTVRATLASAIRVFVAMH